MTKMPLIKACVEAHDGAMTTDQLLRSPSHGNRTWERLLVRLRAPSLDRQLAAGCPPSASRGLALRAQEITSPAGRLELAQWWHHVLDQGRRPPVPRTPLVLLYRDRIADAERDVQDMLTVLTGQLPVTARGAAMASSLLRDGAGPLHNRHSPLSLGDAVREATRQMTMPQAGPQGAHEGRAADDRRIPAGQKAAHAAA